MRSWHRRVAEIKEVRNSDFEVWQSWLWETALAAQELQDQFPGFHLARSFDLREIGLLYYVMASSDRLADALRNAERNSRINNEGVRLRFRSGGATVIALEYLNVDRCSDQHQMEFWLVAVVRLSRQLTSSRLAPRKLTVRHFRDGTPAEYKSLPYRGREGSP